MTLEVCGQEPLSLGDFSMAIAGLGVGLQPSLAPTAAADVLFLTILGPIVARSAK